MTAPSKKSKLDPWAIFVHEAIGSIVPAEEFSKTHLDLKKTSVRLKHSFEGMLGGYRELGEIEFTVFKRETTHPKQMVVQSHIPFTSMCAHHFLPFRGTAAVGYLPDSLEVGLSKLTRVTRAFAMRLQTQESMTDEIADWLMSRLNPLGVGVIVKAEHMCMACRGVSQPGVITSTSALRGLFFENAEVRDEFLSLSS